MIKRYILHIEFHWGYRPRISIKRVPRPGEVVVDGGEVGTLVICPECSGQGLLHLVEPKQYMAAQPGSLFPEGSVLQQNFEALVEEANRSYHEGLRRSDHISPLAMDFNTDVRILPLPLIPETSKYKVGNSVRYRSADYAIKAIGQDTEGIRRNMYLAPSKVLPEGPAEHVILGYELGMLDHKLGETLYTHNSEYLVDGIFHGNLYLTRKDLWENSQETQAP